MVMITDAEFVAEMLDKGLKQYKNKRQLAFAIGLSNPQTLNHWITRDKVPGDWKPKVADLLDIQWLDSDAAPSTAKIGGVKENTKNYGSPPEPVGSLDYESVEFALAYLQLAKDDPEFEKYLGTDWSIRAFIKLYDAASDKETRALDPKTLLRLVS